MQTLPPKISVSVHSCIDFGAAPSVLTGKFPEGPASFVALLIFRFENLWLIKFKIQHCSGQKRPVSLLKLPRYLPQIYTRNPWTCAIYIPAWDWTHLFCVCFWVCARLKPKDPQIEPHGWEPQYRQAGTGLGIWCLSMVFAQVQQKLQQQICKKKYTFAELSWA